MHVMIADTSGEPSQDCGKLVERPALERSRHKIPVGVVFPVDALELVLDIKQPDTGNVGDIQRNQLDHQKHFPAEQKNNRGRENYQCGVGAIDAAPIGTGRFCSRDAVGNEDYKERAQQKHDHRVAVKTVLDPLRPRCLGVFPDSHHPDVPLSPFVEVAGGGVVPGVAGPPAMVGSERQKSGDNTPETVGLLRPEERPVAAVVKDDKYPDQKTAHENNDGQGEPERIIQHAVSDIP